MSIPNFEVFMNPILKTFKDGKEKRLKDILQIVIEELNISKAETEILLPSGRETIVKNRAQWAIYYMKRAGLLENSQRGIYKITELGNKTLHDNAKINREYLSQFDSFNKFTESFGVSQKTSNAIEDNTYLDPNTKINRAVEELNQKLQIDLLAKVKSMDPVDFERMLLDLLVAMGYAGGKRENAELTQKSHDGGIDGIIKEDALGLDKIYVQAKRYADNNVNPKEMQNFIGALTINKSNKGVFITTSEFADKSEKMAEQNKIVLIDGQKLTNLMIAYNVGVIPRDKIEIKEVDIAYFDED